MERVEFRQDPYAQEITAQRAAECRQFIDRLPTVLHLGHFRRTTHPDFTFDRLTQLAALDGAAERRLPERKELEQAAGRLTFQLAKLGDQLAELDTGPLIRLVVHGRQAAMICDTIVPDQCLVATILAAAEPDRPLSRQPDVDRVDHALSQLIDELRAKMSLASGQAGGYTFRGEPPAQTAPWSPRTAPTDLPDLIRQALADTPDLHYLALFHGTRLISELDGFDRPSARSSTVGTISQDGGNQGRIARYQSLGRRAPSLVHALGRVTRPMIESPAERVVLDVERGAVYLYQLPGEHHLMAVTLDQRRVSIVEDVVAQLAVLVKQHLPVMR